MDTRNEKKGIDLPTHAQYVGRDEDGREHYYSAYESTIYVLKAGRRVHIQRFGDIDGLAQWVSDVNDESGWDELQYQDGSIANFILDRLEEVSE